MESAFNQVLGMFKPSIDLLTDDKSIKNISESNILLSTQYQQLENSNK